MTSRLSEEQLDNIVKDMEEILLPLHKSRINIKLPNINTIKLI